MSVDQQPSSRPDEQKNYPDILDGQALKQLVEAGLTWLRTNQQLVNSLNVFPVPDGDTGTNMVLTMQAAHNEIIHSGEKNVGRMAHAIAQGALMGARGNSGVILSQLWRGFARALDNYDTIDARIFVNALVESRNTAYKGVVRPVEGTILTVAKDMAAEGLAAIEITTDMTEILEKIVAAADVSVQHTPELLPILKQAGVVDSGGKGLFFILEGMLRSVKGLALETPIASVQPLTAMNLENTMESIEPGQDYEVVIDFRPNTDFSLDQFYTDLTEIGTSIQVGEGDGIYRMHIHVPLDKRYTPIDYTMTKGTITKIAMENLLAQMDTAPVKESKLTLTPVEPGEIAVVAVSPGPGLTRIFASLGVSAIVEGGQTMNPSTEEILGAFENLPTDKVIILPNNKNIILTAQAAAQVTVKKVAVVPSKSVPQGFSAMLRALPDGDFAEVVQEMTSALAEVQTGEVTIATRSVELNGVQVHVGEVIGLLDGKLVVSADTIEEASLKLLSLADDLESRERITLYYGSDTPKSEINKIADKIRAVYPSHEVEIHNGGQPHYQIIMSLE